MSSVETRLDHYHDGLVSECIYDLFITPRITLYRWSRLTEQTNHTKIGYTGQHLASVVLNVKGCKTGARGKDCMDGTEVKSCSRVDQSDKCTRCKVNVLRVDDACPACLGGDKIVRNNDTKWLLTIRSEDELNAYLRLDRLLLIIEEYPDFDKHDYKDITITMYEIYPNKDICKNFGKLITNYYNDIYSKNLQKNPKKVPAPKNLWPHSYQFHMCNPHEVFKCKITDHLRDPTLTILKHLKPTEPRTRADIAPMPVSLLNTSERKLLKTESSVVSLEDKERLSLR